MSTSSDKTSLSLSTENYDEAVLVTESTHKDTLSQHIALPTYIFVVHTWHLLESMHKEEILLGNLIISQIYQSAWVQKAKRK